MGFFSIEYAKYNTAGILIYLECQNKVHPGSYIVENYKIRYG